MFMTDDLGRRVVKFLDFREEISPFGFLRIMGAEKNGFDVPKVLHYSIVRQTFFSGTFKEMDIYWPKYPLGAFLGVQQKDHWV